LFVFFIVTLLIVIFNSLLFLLCFFLLPHCLVNNVGIKIVVVHCYLVVVLILEQHNNYFGQTYNICMWVTKYVVFIWANPRILSPFPFLHLDCINWI
jgi:hypothetical protein